MSGTGSLAAQLSSGLLAHLEKKVIIINTN